MVKKQRKRVLNYSMFISGLITVISGIMLQIGYHIGNPSLSIKQTKQLWHLHYNSWQNIHIIAALLFLILCGVHIFIHKKIYKIIFQRGLYKRNWQVIILSFLFIISVLTALSPWNMIEIHDKVSILLIVFLVLHLAKRL